MPSWENIKVLISLIPGFLSQRIAYYFGNVYTQSTLNDIVTALIFTMVNFMLAIPLSSLVGATRKDSDGNMTKVFLALMCGVALVTGISWAMLERNNVFLNLRLTSKVSQANIWTYLFYEYRGFVRVELKNDEIYVGWVRFNSDQQESNNLLFLKPVWKIHKDGDCTRGAKRGLLVFERNIDLIHFISVNPKDLAPCKLRKSPNIKN
jgi:hypothetical protein